MDCELIRYYRGFIDARGYRWPTLSHLRAGGHDLFGLEDPWNDNEPFNSCVPDGVYDLVPHSSEDHPDTWALVCLENRVVHLPSHRRSERDRYCCVIHPGNWEDDVQGCILPGMFPTIMIDRVHGRPELAVGQSRDAMARIRKTLVPGSKGHRLLIRTIGGAHLFE